MLSLFDRSTTLAIALSTGPIAVVANGLFNAGSRFTAALLIGSTILLAIAGRWRGLRPSIVDVAFVLFCCFVAGSFVANGFAGDRKELYLLVISLAAYPAARGLAGAMPGRGFLLAGGLVVLIGTLATAVALVEQWGSWGKPFVFGRYEAAPAQFMTTLGFLLIAVACTTMNARRAVVAAGLFTIPLAIFAASMVRSTFLATAISVGVAIAIGRPAEWKKTAAILCGLLVALSIGLAARSDVSIRFAGYAVAVLTGKPDSAYVAALPESKAYRMTVETDGCPDISSQNTLAIRKQLYADALALLPGAGLFGIGMGNFATSGCILGHEVHNTTLQALVELGWPAGMLLVAMVVLAGVPLVRMARENLEARFVLCSLTFVIILSMGHGSISRDGVLFLFLGYATAVKMAARPVELAGAEPKSTAPPV